MSRSQVLWALLKSSYIDLVTYGVPGPLSLSYFVPFILLPTALLIPPTHLSRWQAIAFFLVPIYGAIFHAWIVMEGVDVISVDALLWSTFFIAYKDPKRDFKRLRLYRPPRNDQQSKPYTKAQQPKRVEQPYPADFRERLVWVGTLLASTRLHGWKIGEPSHDKAQVQTGTPTRTRFVLSLLPSLVFSLAIFPFIIQLAHHDPNIPSLQPSTRPAPQTITLIQHLLPAAFLTPLVSGLYIHSAISSGFLFPAPLAVLTNRVLGLPSTEWSPHALPAYFGPFAAVLDAGVTGLWGSWWHQHMRVMVSFPGRALGEALRAGPFARYALQVCSAFFFSGVAHMGLVPPKVPDAMALRLRVAGFFWVQALAVLAEAMVARAWRAGGWSAGRGVGAALLRALRLVWVVGWMCLALKLLVLPMERLRWWEGWTFWPLPGLSFWLLPYTSGRWIP